MSRADVSLPDLQYYLKKDPASYKKEFDKTLDFYYCMEQSFSTAPSQDVPELRDTLIFLSQVIQLYPENLERFIASVTQNLLSRAFGMNPIMRMTFLKVFMRLRTKDLMSAISTLDIALRLNRCQDKSVRRTLRTFIINDMKRANQRQRSEKLNSQAKDMLAKFIKDSNTTVAREAVTILVQLFHKRVWADAKTANILADACLSKYRKVYTVAVRFFLGSGKPNATNESDSDSDDGNYTAGQKLRHLQLGHRVGNKTNKRKKRLDRNMEQLKRKEERKVKKQKDAQQDVNLVAMNYIHDPQLFSERLLKKLDKCSDSFESRMLLLELVSRLVGLFKLILLNLYPALQRFLRPQQRMATHLLLFAAQASHDEVPPDVMEPVIRTIADNFVTERASAEAMAVGLNAIREICARCPFAVTEELLSDLVGYQSYRNKNVVAAARSLIRLFRQLNPALLPKKDRGRPTDSTVETQLTGVAGQFHRPALEYGASNCLDNVPGSEVLLLKADGKKIARLTEQDRLEALEKATELTADCVLNDEDFSAMRRYLEKKRTTYTAKGGQKRKAAEVEEESEEESESEECEEAEDEEEEASHPDVVKMDRIMHMAKRSRASKSERLESVEQGRENREKYGFKVSRMNPLASTTNREKKKRKTFSMVKHKARGKVKRSFRDKQIKLREHLLKLAKMSR